MPWTTNGLLSALSQDDRALLLPHLKQITLNQRDVLFECNKPISHVYFFESGLSSEIAVGGSNKIEVGCIGKEGCSGVPVLLGVTSSPHRAFMQAGGTALQIETGIIQAKMVESASLSKVLLRYAHIFMIQIASTALADGRCDVETRLARWLLMCQDRLGDQLPLTHDFLALMLGVRRPSVTDALHKLEGELMIKAERSLITIRSRAALEAVAGSAYGMPEGEYKRLIIPQHEPA